MLDSPNIDLLIVTALTEEQQVVHAVLGITATEVGSTGDLPRRLTLYDFEAGDAGTYRIGAISRRDMGAVAMTDLMADILASGTRPACAVLVGIAATTDPAEAKVGDVPVASAVFSADDIKVKEGRFEFRPAGYPTDSLMRAAAGAIRERGGLHSRWRTACRDLVPRVLDELNRHGLRAKPITVPDGGFDLPRMLVEKGAGGPFLIADAKFSEALRKGDRFIAPLHPKVVWAEMESHGFMYATSTRNLPAIVVKGISDGGDADKERLEKETGGFFRVYACVNSVLSVLEMLRQSPRRPIPPEGRLAPDATSGASTAPAIRTGIPTRSPLAHGPKGPDLFLGRSRDLDVLANLLGHAAESPGVQPVSVSALHGFAGIGKTALAACFSSQRAIAAGFVDGVLWANVAKGGRFLKLAAQWGRVLDDEALRKAASTDEAVERLRKTLVDRRVLVVLDDLWNGEAVLPLRSALGPGSGLLLVTRLPGLPTELGIAAERMHKLSPLGADDALELLDRLCTGIVARDLDACRSLLDKIDRIPIAICAAGRLLRLEQEDGLDASKRLREVDAQLVLSERAPPDRADPESGGTPTIRALLRMSVDLLEPPERQCFAQLGTFGAETTFGEEELAQFWGVEDPRPTIRILRRLGLIEVSGERYGLHSLLAALAAEILDGKTR